MLFDLWKLTGGLASREESVTKRKEYSKQRTSTFWSFGQLRNPPDERAIDVLVLGEPAVDLNETRSWLRHVQEAQSCCELRYAIESRQLSRLLGDRVNRSHSPVLLHLEDVYPLFWYRHSDLDLRTGHIPHFHIRAADIQLGRGYSVAAWDISDVRRGKEGNPPTTNGCDKRNKGEKEGEKKE